MASWNADMIRAWVAETLAGRGASADEVERASALFVDVDGAELRRMALDAEHGFSFADKLFFLGLDKASIGALEDALTPGHP
jgi:hypothetical protein